MKSQPSKSVPRTPPTILNCRHFDTQSEEIMFCHNGQYVWTSTETISNTYPSLHATFQKFKNDLKRIVELLGGDSLEIEDLDRLIIEHQTRFDENARKKAKAMLFCKMKSPDDDDVEAVVEDNVILQKALILQEIYFRKSLQKRNQSVHVFNWTGQFSLPFVQIILKNCYSKKARALLDELESQYNPCKCFCQDICIACRPIHDDMTPEHFLCTVRENNGVMLLLPPGGYFRHRDGYYARSCPKNICPEKNCLQRIPSCPKTISLGVVCTANRGYSLVALEDAEAGTIIAEHKGLVYYYAESEKCKLYSFPLAEDYLTWDGEEYGTLQRFCNNSCDPSMMMVSVLEGGYQGKDKVYRIIHVAKRNIKAGEELTFDYHPRVPLSAKKPSDEFTECKCGAKKCRGWF